MSRTITIKGVGKLSLKPDYTVITLSIRNTDKDYDKAMEASAENLERLRVALIAIGFEKEDLKTTGFNVNAEYESKRDKDGNYNQIFVGYCVRHQMKLEFDFDSSLLSKTLGAVSGCIAEPELNVQFTVKDKEAVNAALLESACANAKEKAEILTKASGVELRTLLSIEYNWGDLNLNSPTRYAMDANCMLKASSARASIDVEPDDITVSDSVNFVWEIC